MKKTAAILGGSAVLLLMFVTLAYATHVTAGDTVEVFNTGGSNLVVRGPNACDAQTGSKAPGSRGTVIGGPAFCNSFNRYKVRWSDGLEGWSAEDFLLKVSITPSTKFSLTDRLLVSYIDGTPLNVRSDPPGLQDIGSVPEGTLGTVVSGPFYGVPTGGGGFYHFWKASFGGITGWVAEDFVEYLLPAPALSSPSNGAAGVSMTPTFSWSSASGATSYRIMVSTSSSALPTDPTVSTCSNCAINAETSSTSYQPAPGILSAGTTYYWTVHGRSASFYGEWSPKWGFTTQNPATVPSPPLNLRVPDAGPGHILLAWDPPSSDGGSPVTNYKIFRGTSPGGETLYFTTATPGTTFNNTANLVAGQTYYYKVKAVNSAGDSGFSNEASATVPMPATTPTPPQNLIVIDVGNGFVFLGWSPPASDGGSAVAQYNIYRGTSLGGESYYATISSAFTTFNNTLVANGVTYYYKVTALNSIGEGAFSNEVSATPQAPLLPPDAPVHLSPSNSSIINATTPTFQWNSDSNADYHGLYVRNIATGVLVFDSDFDYGPIYSNSFTLPGGYLLDGESYRWNMRSFNGAGASGFTDPWYFSVSTMQSPPTPISPGTVSGPPGEVITTTTPTFTWSAAPSASYYAIYISQSPFGPGNLVFDSEVDYGQIAGTSFTLPAGYLQQGFDYRWNMRAFNGAGASNFSGRLYFNTNSSGNVTSAYNTEFITDSGLEDYDSMSSNDIRAFLSAQNSYFSRPVPDVDGVIFDAAVVIKQAADQYLINPKVILATLQKEISGVTRTTRPSDSQMGFLMGCISPTTARQQLTCAAERFRVYHDQLTNTGSTVSGWQVGVAKMTLDGVMVTPANKAVAGQFTYTPYAGVQWGGDQPSVGGVFLFYDSWKRFGFNGTIYPGSIWTPAHTNGYQDSDRESSYDINYIIIHTTESSYQSAINTFQDPAAGRSAHYVISGAGGITAMVGGEDVAYHAGNFNYNLHSIGIEHEGFVSDPDAYTEEMYMASASVAAWLAQKYSVPLVHPAGIAPADPLASGGIIGHDQVPDPNDPGQGGGINHHTDPGQYWNWTYFMSLVADSDGDGLVGALDPCPLDDDCDDDGLTDGNTGTEDLNANGIVDPGETDPANPDTDGDGILDGTEKGLVAPEGTGTNLAIFVPDSDPASTTNPLNTDTDSDGVPDGTEDANGNGATDPGETDPNVVTGRVNWTQLSPSPSPPPRSRFGMAYDGLRSEVVLFGGFLGDTIRESDDTWVFNGTGWAQKSLAAKPPRRDTHAMVYDSARGEVVMFGGGVNDNRYSDTWTWDGSAWTQKFPAASPPQMFHATMAYDPAREEAVLFGGSAENGLLDQTWAWNGVTWTQRFPSVSPPARFQHAMVYDPVRNEVILYGGRNASGQLGDTWAWNGSTWAQKITVGPPALRWPAMAFSQEACKMLLFGGDSSGNYANQTWAWNGTSWQLAYATAAPSGRAEAGLAYDTIRGNAVLFGGNANGMFQGDTWVADAQAASCPAQPGGSNREKPVYREL
ncbi:MAG: N-acetylmuramoyl-L-alanine amidase [Candidatus Aenigmarchaeota archaeon]|nr:N-acetylmuramoyl-L-alanine amidase [Candidatus Aenigmarchaeota archaeon]